MSGHLNPALAQAAQLLAQRYGLDLAAIGPTVLQAALADVIRERAIPLAALPTRLVEPACIGALFKALPVGLSWFDRDIAQLQSAARWAARLQRPLKVLSAPCARGEEVWSVAAALVDAGLAPAAVQILGVDAMPESIMQAERGVYGCSAMPRPVAALPWWLQERDQQLLVDQRLRPMVRFRVGNLLEAAALAAHGPFDLMLSRNFLIYLTAEAQSQWCSTLARQLLPDGRLYVAASEVELARSGGWVALPGEVSGACVHSAGVVASPPLSQVAPMRERRPRLPASVPMRQAPPLAGSVLLSESNVAVGPDPRVLADAGKLDEAEAALAPRLALQVPAAADLVTAALLAMARGQGRAAEESLRRALYLEHAHAEAAGLLAALLNQQGESGLAARLRSRAGLGA